MALHSSAAFASLDVGSLCKTLQGSQSQFKSRDGFAGLSRSFSRNSPRRHGRTAFSVVAAAGTDVSASEEAQMEEDRRRGFKTFTMQDLVDAQPFTINPVDEGVKKDWHPATVLSVEELAAGVRKITIDAEISREMVLLENAYTVPGRLAQVKVKGGKVMKVATSTPPFSSNANEAVLIKARGDIPAGMTKQPQFFLSVKHPLELLVYKAELPQVFGLKEGDELELGPFDFSGLDLRPILFLTRYPTILFFASGKGIAVAKAIIEAKDGDAGSMSLGMREDIRLFYWSPDPSNILFQDKFETWENKKLKVRPAVGRLSGEEWDGHVGSFTTLWDEDDIEYDPSATGVIVCVDRASRAEVDNLLEDAGIPEKQVLRWEPKF